MDYYYSYPYSRADIERAEFKALRKHSKAVGICIVVYILLQQLFLSVLMLLNLTQAYSENPAFQYAVSVLVFGIAAMGVPFFVYSCKKGSLSYRKVLPFDFPQDKKRTLLFVLSGFALCLGANYAAVYVEAVLSQAGVELVQPQGNESSSVLDVFLNFICAAVYAPLVEEFVFRGVIMQPLRRYGDHFAVLASAFIFGLAHASITGFVFAFICGIAMGYATLLTGSLWTGIIIHFCNNFFAVLTSELYTAFPDMGDLPYLAAVYIIFFVGIASVILLALSKSFRFSKPNTVLTKGQRFRAFFLSLPMLAAIAGLAFFILSSVGGNQQ